MAKHIRSSKGAASDAEIVASGRKRRNLFRHVKTFYVDARETRKKQSSLEKGVITFGSLPSEKVKQQANRSSEFQKEGTQ